MITISLCDEKSLFSLEKLINKKIKLTYNKNIYFGTLKKYQVDKCQEREIIRSVGFDSVYIDLFPGETKVSGIITYVLEDLQGKINLRIYVSYFEEVYIVELQDNPNDFGFVL